MKKSFVLTFFSGVAKAARALEIKSAAVSQWPEDLPDSAVGRIVRLRPDVLRAWWRQQRQKSDINQPQGNRNV